MATHVSYNSKRLIPAPLISINKIYDTTEDGTPIGSTFNIDVNGTLVVNKGSPSASGTGANWSDYFWTSSGYPDDEIVSVDARLHNILRKQEALRRLFSDEGLWFEVQSNGTGPLKFQPRIKSITFPEGQWVETCPYQISLEADIVYMNGTANGEDNFTEYISSANESWDLEFDEERNVFALSHSVSAVGKRVGTAWHQARTWVQQRLGFDSDRAFASGVWNRTLSGYNHIRTEQVGEYDGSYSVNETWVCSDQNYIDEYTVTVNNTVEGNTTIGIEGTVTGLDTKNSQMAITQSRYTAGSGAFYNTVQPNLYSRALNTAGLSYLNATPLSYSTSINPNLGIFNYTYNYDNRPANCVPGARFEQITITDNNPGQIVAVIPVLGRTAGPILQDIGTYSERTRNVNIEVVLDPAQTCSGKLSMTKPNVSGILTTLKPAGAYTVEDTETWDISNNRFSRSVTYLW